jgi:hypothetical protein
MSTNVSLGKVLKVGAFLKVPENRYKILFSSNEN